ncbi:helix-turn-helix transcriptional regulator [Streptomyces sp. NPDC001678]|uniref:helix-turn-helix transcriptional regulator n=1 Tax=Streptomyces sp. NPDC001678 TaxID=3364599 RepID=UPI0036A4ED39
MARVALMSSGHFSRGFRAAFGESPSAYRARRHEAGAGIPACVAKICTRPLRIGEADPAVAS